MIQLIHHLQVMVHRFWDYIISLGTVGNRDSGFIGLMTNELTSILGWMLFILTVPVRYAVRRLLRMSKRILTTRRIRAANSDSYRDRHLLVISGSDIEIKREHFQTMWSDRDDFQLAFPEKLRSAMLALQPDYVMREKSLSARYEELFQEAMVIVPDLENVIEQARFDAAEIMLERARQSKRVFNGYVFQASDIVPGATTDRDEDPTISLIVYRTDFFTLTTLFSAFKAVRERDVVIEQWKGEIMPRPLRLLYSGIGLNVLVIAIDERINSKYLVLRKRSSRAISTVATGQWHVTVNEALSTTEVEQREILFETWIRRGLREEAGLQNLKHYMILDFFLVLDDMQPGVSVLAFCSYNHFSLQRQMDASKDGLLEYGATTLVPFDDVSIEKVLRNRKGIWDGQNFVALSAVAENVIRGISARGTTSILSRAGLK